MLRILDSHHDATEWEKLVPTKDPHFNPDYYQSFGGGHLAVFNDGEVVQPFRFQESGWIGNVYNFGGMLGPPEQFRPFCDVFDAWKQSNKLNERCTINPYFPSAWNRAMNVGEVVYVDLVKMDVFRPTTRHQIVRAKKNNVVTTRVEPDRENAFLFEMIYERAMSLKNAAPHWHYPHGRFFNILNRLGPKRSALFLTKVKGSVESGCLLIFDKINCFYHWAARLGEHPNAGADHFQVATVIEWAAAEGHKTLMLGGNGPEENSTLMTFKQGFSRKTLPCFRYVTKVS